MRYKVISLLINFGILTHFIEVFIDRSHFIREFARKPISDYRPEFGVYVIRYASMDGSFEGYVDN